MSKIPSFSPKAQSGLLLILALTLLFPLPAVSFEWGRLVDHYEGYSFVPGLLFLLSCMTALACFIAHEALKPFGSLPRD